MATALLPRSSTIMGEGGLCFFTPVLYRGGEGVCLPSLPVLPYFNPTSPISQISLCSPVSCTSSTSNVDVVGMYYIEQGLGCRMFITPLVLSCMNFSPWAEHPSVASRKFSSHCTSPMELM